MLNDLELTGRARTHVVQRDDLHAALHRGRAGAFPRDESRCRARRDRHRDHQRFPRFRGAAAHLEHEVARRAHRSTTPAGTPRDHAALDAGRARRRDPLLERAAGREPPSLGQRDRSSIDRAAMPEGYRVQLLPAEAAPGGVFHALHCWLDENMARYGFFRPYRHVPRRRAAGAVAPELRRRSSVRRSRQLTPELLAEAVELERHARQRDRAAEARRHPRSAMSRTSIRRDRRYFRRRVTGERPHPGRRERSLGSLVASGRR